MPIVNIPGVGSVNFPDTMSNEDITKVIETDILKTSKIPQEPIVESAKPTASDAFESNLLSPLMAMSRGFGSLTKGGVSEDALSSAVNTAEQGREEHPVAGSVGKFAALIGPSVPVLGAMPILAPAAGLGGMGAGIAGGAAAAPTVGVGTGVERYQSLLNKGIPEDEAKKAGIAEGVINAASNLIPTRGGLIARGLQGSVINAATGAGNRAIQNELITDPVGHQEVFDPKAIALDMALGGLTEGAFGSRSHEKLLAKNEPAGVVRSAQQRLNTGTGSSISDIELRLLQDNHYMLSKRRLDLEEELKVFNKLIEDGLASEQVVNHVKGIEGEIKSVDSTINKLDKIFSDPKQLSESQRTDHKALQDIRKNELIEQIKAQRKAFAERRALEEADTQARAKSLDEESQMIGEDAGLSDVNPKTPPPVIAADNIGKAISNPNLAPIYLQNVLKRQGELEARIAKEKLPGSEYSSLKESLEVEAQAYRDIIAGKQPDLSWFDNAPRTDVEAPRINEQVVGDTHVPTTKNNAPTLEETLSVDNQISQGYHQDRGLPTSEDVPVFEPSRDWIGAEDIRGKELPVKEELKPAFKDYFDTQNELASIDRFLNKIAGRYGDGILNDYEKGLSPSGTVEISQVESLRKSLEVKRDILEDRITNLVKTNPKLREWLQTQGNKKAIKVSEDLVVNTKQYKDLNEILEVLPHNLIDTFINNPQFFNQAAGTKIHFDKGFSSDLQAMFTHYVNKLGLQHDQLFVVLDKNIKNKDVIGNVELFGNTGLIRIDPEKIQTHIKENVQDKKNVIGKMSALGHNIHVDFLNARVAAHELGHFLFIRYLRDIALLSYTGRDFKSSKVANEFINKYESWKESKNADMYQPDQRVFFDEFFADAVARELVFKHTLSSFGENSGIKAIQSLFDLTRTILQKKHPKVEIDNFITELTNKLITDNKKSIEETGKTIWQQYQMMNRDNAIFQGYSLEDVRFDVQHFIPEWFKNSTSEMRDPHFVPDTNWSTEAAITVTKKSFGKTQANQIFLDNPKVQEAYWTIRDAESIASKASNKIWHGQESYESWDKKSIFTKFNKTKDGSSPYHQIQKTSDLEMYRIEQVLQKGFDERLEYANILEKYGQHLTENEVKTYNTLTKMWTEQHTGVTALQTDLNKKHILPYRPGWFPSVHEGNFYVTIGFDGNTSYRQHFSTKTAAEAFIKEMQNSEFKHLDISPPQKKVISDTAADQRNVLAEAIESMINTKYPNAGPKILEDIENLKTLMAKRGGKFGMHHEERTGILGFKGSEINLSPIEQGRSFKEAIIKSVSEYSDGLKNMYVKSKVGPMLEDTSIDPNTKTIIQQMYDSTLSRNSTKVVDEFNSALRESVERKVRAIIDTIGTKIPGVQYKGQKAALDTAINGTLEMLYLYKVMAKTSFILGQFMTPIQSIRHMSYDSGYLSPYVSMGKGMWNLATGNKELKEALYKTRNESHTFEPAFIDALHLTNSEGAFMKTIKDFVMLRKPAEFADTMSRVITFSAMFEHYKSLGNDFDKSVKLAQQGTDATMVQYSKAESAPMFQHLGMIGDQIRPLQTFPTAALGNLVADLKHMNSKDFKSFAPFVNYVLTCVALGGVMSLQFMQEYELIRKWMEDKDPGSGPPAITDIMIKDPSMFDRVEVDPTAIQQALLLGIPSAVSGIDLASSLRSNEALATTVVGIATGHKAFVEMLPLVNFATDVVGGFSTLISGRFKDLSVAEKAKAIDKAGPSGHFGYGLKEFGGVNESKLFGENTGMMTGGKEADATQERTTLDKVAGYMGTKATDTRTNLLLNMRMTELDKRRTEQIKKNANLFVETGKPIYLERLQALDVTDNQLENTVTNTVYKKIVDQRLRNVASKSGTINTNKAENAIKYGTLE